MIYLRDDRGTLIMEVNPTLRSIVLGYGVYGFREVFGVYEDTFLPINPYLPDIVKDYFEGCGFRIGSSGVHVYKDDYIHFLNALGSLHERTGYKVIHKDLLRPGVIILYYL